MVQDTKPYGKVGENIIVERKCMNKNKMFLKINVSHDGEKRAWEVKNYDGIPWKTSGYKATVPPRYSICRLIPKVMQ